MKKSFFAILLVIILLLTACYFLGTRETVSHNILEWDYITETNDYLPSVSNMGSYEDLEFKHLHKDILTFKSDAYILIASYDKEETFNYQKQHLTEGLVFQDVVKDYGDKERMASFEFDGFEFQMLSLEEYELSYPERISFVGISEEKNKLAFIYFEDAELDYIDEEFSNFLIEECGWELTE